MVTQNDERSFVQKKKDLEFVSEDEDFHSLSRKEIAFIEETAQDTEWEYDAYVHDADLDEEVFNRYEVGQLLYHPTELFFTSDIKGMHKKYRFLVFSNYIKDLSDTPEAIDEMKSINLCRSNLVESFKIIDIYGRKGKIQISLINYPPASEILFKNHVSKIEADLIKKARRSFEKSLNKEPIPELYGRWGTLFDEPIGIREFNYRWRFYSRRSMLAFLDILEMVKQAYGLEDTFDFIHRNDMSELINVYDENVDEILKVNANASKEEIQKEIDECVYDLANIVKEGIQVSQKLGPSFKEDMVGLSDKEKALKLNEAFRGIDQEYHGIISVTDDKGSQLLPILNMLDITESFLFIQDIVGDWDLSALPGYDRRGLEIALEEGDEQILVDFLKSNEEAIAKMIPGKLKEKTI